MLGALLVEMTWRRFVLSALCLFAISICYPAKAEATDIQRMRIPVGTYWIGGAGGGVGGSPPKGSLPLERGEGTNGSYRLPAFCIDEGRKAPFGETDVRHFSGNVLVRRFQGNKKLDERSLDQAVSGVDPWLKFNGIGPNEELGSPVSLAVTPLDEAYSYSIDVTGLTLAGTDQADVETIFAQWSARPDLQEAAAVFDALRHYMLQSGSEAQAAADTLERSRQDFEWTIFGDASEGAKLPSTPINHADIRSALAALPAEAFGLSPDQIDNEQIFDWLRLSTAILPTKEQLDTLAASLKAVGFDGTWQVSDAATTAALLRAYRGIDRWAVWHADWSAFAAVRQTAKSNFDDALRVLALSDFHEEALTSGRIDIPVLARLRCERLRGAGGDLAEAKLADALAKLVDLANALDFFRGEGRLVKVTASEDKLCFQWIENGEVKSRILDRSQVGKDQLVAIGGKLWLVDDELTDIADALEDAGVTVETAQALSSRLAAEAQVKTKDNEDMHIRSIQRRDTRGLDVAILNLSTNGDANIISLPDGSLMIVDTGLGSDIVERLKSYILRNYKKDRPPIRLVITHTDQDHLGGLTALLAAQFQMQEVIIGTSLADARRPERVDPVKSAFKAAGYEVVATDSVIHIKRPGIAPLIDLDKPISSYSDGFEGWRLYLGDQAEISMFHATDAVAPNDSGFLVKLVHRGRSVLLTDDLSATTLRAMTTSLDPSILRAGFLKWPHHLWFPPGLTQAREVLGDFLKMVSPHTVAFSGVGHKSHNQQRYEDICNYLHGQIAKSVVCYWTRGEMANVALEL
ncbi:MBL fold metallo-hydrolase [Rhizobium ruizarguesonis]